MAGFDWSCFVYRNGEPSEQWRLGTGRVRLDHTKNYPLLIVDEVEMPETEFTARFGQTYLMRDEEDGALFPDLDLTRYEGDIDGYRFRARHFAGRMLDLELIEPDGTVWTARCGFEYGERFEDSENTRHYGRVPWVF